MIHAVTFDFWDTLFPVVGGQDAVITDGRVTIIRAFLAETGREVTDAQARAAYGAADRGHRTAWETDLRQPGVERALADIQASLGFELKARERKELVRRFWMEDEMSALEPFDGVPALLQELVKDRRLGIISDTWLTPGTMVRKVLKRHRLLKLFTAAVFSDETGWLKPHPRQFHIVRSALSAEPGETLHVGDSERRDVRGAKAAGMKALLIDPDPPADTQADAVVAHPSELAPAIERLIG